VKTFQPRLFQPLLPEPQNLFDPNTFFNPTSLPFRLWDGFFKIPKAIRQLFTPPAPSKPEKEPQNQVGKYRPRRKLKFQVEVLAYPLRPKASHIPLRGELKNFSNNGVCVEFLKDIEENHLFLLDFQMPEKKNIRLPARVIWSRKRLSGFEVLSANHAKKILKESKSA
jgi:hypothetical protein